MLKNRSSLAMMAAIALGALASVPATGQQCVTRTSARPPRPRRVQLDEEVADARKREIAAWNEAVEKARTLSVGFGFYNADPAEGFVIDDCDGEPENIEAAGEVLED